MSIELLIAPPASGKTLTCIERIKTIRSGQPLAKIWVIVPDRMQAAAFRRRLAASGGTLGTQVGRFRDLYVNILEHSGTYVPTASSPLLIRLIQETVDDSVAQGEIPYFAPLQLFPGFILALRDSFAELKRALVYPELFLKFASDGSAAEKDLAVLYSRYQARLQELNWADSEEINWLAIASLESKLLSDSEFQLVIVDGFDSFNGAQFRVLKLLSEQVGELLITFPGARDFERPAHHRFTKSIEKLISELSPKTTQLENAPYLPENAAYLEIHLFEVEPASKISSKQPILLEARSPVEEARETLRWIKKLVVRENISLSNCVIFTPNPRVYHPLLRISADEFGIPIQFTLDEPLDDSPAIIALMNLLSLPVKNFNSRYLINVLYSPYFDFSIDTETVDILELVSRTAQIVEGQDQWEEVWERLGSSTNPEQSDLDDERTLRKLPRGSDVEVLRQVMEFVFKTITPPEKVWTQTEWISWLEDLLDHLRFYEKVDNDRDLSVCEAFRETLRALVLSESVAGARHVDYDQFLSILQGTLPREGYRESSVLGLPTLLIGRMTEARGTRFQAVALLGLSEGSFPTNEHPDPFLDEDLRAALGLDSRLEREQAGLFYQAVTRTDQHLLLTRPYLSEDGEEWEKSTFWNAAEKLFDDSAKMKVNPYDDQMLSESASSQDLLFSAVRRRSLPKKYVFLEERWRDLQHAQKVLRARRSKAINGPYEGFIPSVIPFINQRYSPSVTWSASRLESYSNCPHQFFVNNALELEARVLPKLGLDSTQLGTMLHKILELTYKNSADMTDLQSNLASLQESSQKQFSAVPKSLAYRPSALWEVEKVQFLEKLKNTICELAKDANWVPFAFEKKFGLEGEPPLEILTGDEKIVIRGLIDRVDKNSSGQLRVLDYKTGGSHLGSGDLKDGYRLQLPIYAMAARDALHLGTPVDGIYWKILAAEPGSLKLASFNTNGLVGIDAAIQVVCEHLLRIISGIRAAEFPPQPPKGGCPSYCPAVQWCWRYEPGW